LVLRSWIRRLVRRADEVVGQSTNTLDNLRRYYVPEYDGVRIPLGIRRPPEGIADRTEYGLGPEEILLVTVGRVVARKAVHQLLDVVAAMHDLPIRLLVVGDGPLVPSLREECGKRDLARRVIFLGKVSELEKFRVLRMSDLFVSTSQHEGFGLVFLEAMACGLPVVCYNHGGQTDFLVDSTTGHLLQLNDLDGFTRCCRRLAGEQAERQRMGAENLERVEDFFIERCAVKYEEVFERVLRLRGDHS
jgi:glycosyltransferase involved in cell wall biosynthesis